MVPVVDLSRRAGRLAADYRVAVDRVLASGWFVLGPELEAFEAELADWSGHRHAVGLSSGAAALQLALTAAGIGPGDEVLVPAFTAAPTASAVCAAGAVPIPVDVDPGTALVPADGWDEARTERTRAAIVVHLYGRPADAPHTDLPVIDDAAQAHGALLPGSGSAATAYSFYPTKNLGGIGDGGALVTDDDELAARVRRLRVHGMEGQYVHVDRSQSFRMSELEAAWLRLGLATLGDDNARRRAIAARYRSIDGLTWQTDHAAPRPPPGRAADRRSGAGSGAAGRRRRGDRGALPAEPHRAARLPGPRLPPVPRERGVGGDVRDRPLLPRADGRRGRPCGGGAHPAGGGRLTVPHPPAAGRPIVTSVTAFFPCYNDAPTIAGMVEDARTALRRSVDDFEIIVVDDGSQDGSAAVLADLATSDPRAARRDPRVQPRLRRRARSAASRPRRRSGSSTPTATASTTPRTSTT